MEEERPGALAVREGVLGGMGRNPFDNQGVLRMRGGGRVKFKFYATKSIRYHG